MKTIINVSNRLPVTINGGIKRSAGGLAAAMESLGDSLSLKWVGWAGGSLQNSDNEQTLAQQIKEQFNYLPVFLNQQDAADYYDGYSNSSLWPLLHYMTTYGRYHQRWFEAYKRVNEVFADAVLQVVENDALVWVHDYHLMLLPAILKDRKPDLKIGFFLHTPFPSSEIFRCQPNRKALLWGLLGANLIGFQTFGYLRHFRSTLLRVLGLESDMGAITHERHVTSLGVYPIGINSQKFKQELRSDAFIQNLVELSQAHHGKKIILNVERLDYTKGIPRRLDAIDEFLSQLSRTDDVVFIFISVPSREDVEAYKELVDEVQGRVSQINGKYSTIKNVPVHFIHQSVDFSQLCALYSIADVCMVTPMIDGMNLVAKEYIACQREKSGVLILSEFAGAAQELHDALIVNPYNTQQMVENLNKALNMGQEERQKRMSLMKERVMTYDALHWANTFIKDLEGQKNIRTGSGGARLISMDDVASIYQAKRVGLFLDYDGTLAELRNKPADAYPRKETRELFAQLTAADGVDVCIISGRKRADMQEWFGSLDVTLVAEHGFYYMPAGASQWHPFDDKVDLEWMERIIEVFQHYSGMTPGSAVEVKTASVVWHYRESDPEFGTWKANQLAAELHDMLSNLPVEIHHGKKIVEVCSIQVNKGLVMDHLFSERGYDAGLCAGDDETDESMFRSQIPQIISVKVGEGTTAAKFRTPSPAAFRRFLWELAQVRADQNSNK